VLYKRFYGQILAGVRTATVDVQDVSPEHDYSRLEITVVSPFFEGLAKFKRRDMVNSSLNGLRSEPGFYSQVVEMHLYSPAEVGTTEGDEEGEES
jgi:acid stress-induced BolA-like protein IbaG/YrbA